MSNDGFHSLAKEESPNIAVPAPMDSRKHWPKITITQDECPELIGKQPGDECLLMFKVNVKASREADYFENTKSANVFDLELLEVAYVDDELKEESPDAE